MPISLAITLAFLAGVVVGIVLHAWASHYDPARFHRDCDERYQTMKRHLAAEITRLESELRMRPPTLEPRPKITRPA